MPALVTRVGHADLAGRKLVGDTEKSAVWAGIRAKAFRARKYTVMNPQINRNGIATRSGGNVSQKLLVTR